MSSTLVIDQPQPVMVVRNSNEWGSGICDCCEDVPECCCAFWCFPCFACRTSICLLSDCFLTSWNYGEALCLPLVDIFLSGFVPPVTMSMRGSMRQRYGIKGTMCNDCVYSTFCPSCTWCQMSREMKKRNIQVVLVSSKNT
ncbi:hypothetical protein L3Q82_022509 [Scortum barcoo]|uniref:Uncharacterized protein n=1 Tax=Scortum barcoo TaxID=214431 RepID=A0ACB8X242_9TELE|nr:hypothetical protein L3Q82_022509 [Scortum barcoo]